MTQVAIANIQCKRCGWVWVPRVSSPRVCPKCHSAWWDVDKEGPVNIAPQQRVKKEVIKQPSVPQYVPNITPNRQPQPVIEEFYEGQHIPRQDIENGREAVRTMINDYQDPASTSIQPDELMPVPVRKCKKCGFVGFADQMIGHLNPSTRQKCN